MTFINSRKWLLLIHQIPPKPNALRVKIWRRLQQIGAVAVKQSVYALPLSEQSREDLSWTLNEIVDGGGDGSISEVRFVEGLTDEQIIALFQKARKSDYEKIIKEASTLLAEGSSPGGDPLVGMTPAQLARLQCRLDETAAIDFFQAPERGTAEILLKELSSLLSGKKSAGEINAEVIENLKGRVWVTRRNVFVDRMACSWLIKRFVDPGAVFKFIPETQTAAGKKEVRFDMFEGEYTHEGDKCTFEVMIDRLQLQDKALVSMAELVHDIDLKDARYNRLETEGFKAVLTGLVASQPDDDIRVLQGFSLFENLYAYFHRHKD